MALNKQNLKPVRTVEEAREKGRAGGIASVKARREKKSAREFAEAALNAEVTDKATGKKIVVKDAIIQGVIAKAIQEKDLAAIKYLFELTGESPVQRMEITGAEGKDLIPQRPLTREELKELHRKLEEE